MTKKLLEALARGRRLAELALLAVGEDECDQLARSNLEDLVLYVYVDRKR